MSKLLCIAAAALCVCDAAITPMGPHDVKKTQTTAGTLVYYPTGAGSFPLIAFGHGATAGGAVTALLQPMHQLPAAGSVAASTSLQMR